MNNFTEGKVLFQIPAEKQAIPSSLERLSGGLLLNMGLRLIF